jgi:MurNAc alpha-1-phosphate uridylyltransferase
MYSLTNDGSPKWTFGNIGVYRPEMFDGIAPGEHAKLGPLMRVLCRQETGRRRGLRRRVGQRRHRRSQLDLLNAPIARARGAKGVQ